MNIIIEGPDATGKTTLVEKILVKNNLTTIHGTAKTPNDLPYYLDLLDGNGQIFDRFHFSEYIFPQIYGRMPKLTFNDFEAINKKLIETDTYFILFVTSDMEILNKRLIERGEYNYLEEIIPQNILFSLFGKYFDDWAKKSVPSYNKYYIIDIAKENSYKKLDEWLATEGIL